MSSRIVGFARIAQLILVSFVASTAFAQPAAPTPPPPTAPPVPDQPPANQPPPGDQPPAAPSPDQTPAPTAPPPAPPPAPADQPAPPLSTAPKLEERPAAKTGFRRNFAGSIQLDYMAIPTETTGRTVALDGATAEASLKIAMDFNNRISGSVKMCVACHGFETGMAFFDLRVADELNFRVGRFTPSFGEFPLRHDPANHRTSDKPLPYDMGRMVRYSEWNEGVLPSPWVDNGLEINGTHYIGEHIQTSYALYAIGGPRAASNPVDFDYKLSRSGESYYIDNNSRPVLGGQIVGSYTAGKYSATAGASMMRGTYDPDHKLPFAIWGAHFILRLKDVFLRLEYLNRRTKMDMGDDPASEFKYGPGKNGVYDPYFVKEGGYGEIELPLNQRVTLVWREDFLRRRGNVVKTSELRSDSALVRHTAGLAIALVQSLRIKLSFERYDFSDFQDEDVVHVGIAGPF